MGLEHFYKLSDADMPDTVQAKPSNPLDRRDLLRAEALPAPDLNFTPCRGTKWRDLLATGYAGLYLVSDRFRDVLRGGGFSGWTALPVDIRDEAGAGIGGYSLFAVTGRCGPILEEQSPLVYLPKASGVGLSLFRIGYVFDLGTWDGSDVFCPTSNESTFVTERVKTAVMEAQIENVEFRKVTEIKQLVIQSGTRDEGKSGDAPHPDDKDQDQVTVP